MSRIPLRYYVGYSLVLASRLLWSVFDKLFWVAMLPQRFSVIVGTPREIDRYTMAFWDRRSSVEAYSRMDDWLYDVEKNLVEQHFVKQGTLLNVACGAGREALLLARRGIRVTACDWSPRMIAEAQRRAQEANAPVRFEVVDLYNLPYHEQAFDYLLGTNFAYSCLFPRRRRLCFLRQAYSLLKPGGVFIISFLPEKDPHAPGRFAERLFMGLRQYAPFNKEYEPGDIFLGVFIHWFYRPEELKQEFEEAKFLIKDWRWDQGYAVLTKD